MSLLQRAVEWIRARTDTTDTTDTSDETENRPTETPEPDEIRARQVFNITREIDSNGAVYIPADARRTDEFGDLQENDVELHCVVTPTSSNDPNEFISRSWEGYINSGNRLTIPAEYRTELDISEGDTVKIAATVQYEENNNE
jgi:bifunctional DNA-binding transcriptional regulator/antitoxin component of YhaV-PrlF toxin-antitoxin module